MPDDHRYFAYRALVNEGMEPGDEVINMTITQRGHEYRDETEGEHPVVDLRESTRAKSHSTVS
jgi:hypothetical protein